MRNLLLLGCIALSASVPFACSTSDSGTNGGALDDAAPTTIGDDAATDDDFGQVGVVPGGAGTGANTGLPCDVQAILEVRCIGCHSGSSPPPLLTYKDLTSPSKSDPSKTEAQLSAVRLKSTTSPMPPPPAEAPTADEIATFEAWVAAGTPMGTACTDTPDGGIPDAGAGQYNTPLVCTSKTTYKGGENANMRPGEACQACHQQQGGPAFTFAGTVYPTAHEPNDCNGIATPTVTVAVTDKNGKVTNMTTNGVGNFSARARGLTAPFHVTLSANGKTRSMVGGVTSGDCNSCHTVNGLNGAPGRVMAP